MTPSQKQAIRDSNMAHQNAIAARLAAIDPVWGEAWLSLICRSGKRYGLLKRQKPRYGAKLGPEAGLMWEAWQEARGQISAHRLGVGPAYRSFGGTICSAWACSRADKMEAWETAIDAIIEQYKLSQVK